MLIVFGSKINADRVWYDFGVAGQGITVANLDSGVAYEHTALVQQYRGYRGAGTFDHNYNWFDPQGIAPSPIDAVDHGTHVMGTMVGRGNGSETQPAVGVAPAAHWIAARGCRSGTCYDMAVGRAHVTILICSKRRNGFWLQPTSRAKTRKLTCAPT